MPVRSSTRSRCGRRWHSRRSHPLRQEQPRLLLSPDEHLQLWDCRGQVTVVARSRSTRMKAVGYKKSLPIDAADALIDFEAANPEPRGRDIRVAVKAISANPVDYKVRKRAAP